jgi:hypothetical protein
MIEEDIPVNNTAGVAGIGVGPQGEPGVSPKVQKKRYGKNRSMPTSAVLGYFRRKAPNQLAEETFAGATVFEVSSHTFHNAKMEKRKGKHWRTYLDECDELAEIREYANKNPGKPIVLQNRNTNEMVYVRYGKGR